MFKSGFDQKKIESLVKQITGLDVLNELLATDVNSRDSLISSHDSIYALLQDSLYQSRGRLKNIQAEFGRLEAKYEHLSDSLTDVPADTSYSFLVNEAYPYTGQMKYPFNEPQVKGIHLTYLEKEQLSDMNENLLAQVDENQTRIMYQDTLVDEQAAEILQMKSNRQDLDSILINKDQIITMQDKQIHKERIGKRIWQTLTGVVMIIFTAFALGGG